MTYASQQLAEALQELASKADLPHDYSKRDLPASIEAKDVEFPPAVAEFLVKTNEYTERTKSVSIGIY